MRLRVSLLGLMALVLFVAIGLAAAIAGAFAFAVVALSAVTLGAWLRRGPARAFFGGFAAFGWAFLWLAFGAGPEVRRSLPTVRPMVRIHEAIHGPGPITFRSPEEVGPWVTRMAVEVNGTIATGHSLIALVLGLIGGALTWGVARWWTGREGRGPARGVGGPIG